MTGMAQVPGGLSQLLMSNWESPVVIGGGATRVRRDGSSLTMRIGLPQFTALILPMAAPLLSINTSGRATLTLRP
jgi:hypothetical protein